MQDVLLSPYLCFLSDATRRHSGILCRTCEHVIHKFGFIACFVTVQVKCIQPCRCGKTITFLNEVGILHIRIERLQASQREFLLPGSFPFLHAVTSSIRGDAIELSLHIVILIHINRIASCLVLSGPSRTTGSLNS